MLRKSTGIGLIVVTVTLGGMLPYTTSVVGAELIDPSECRVEPRSIDEFRELPDSAVATPERDVLVEEGRPVDDPEVIEGVTATVREQTACLNAWDIPRAAAFYTDEAFVRSFLGPGRDITDEELENLLQPREIPADQLARLISVDNVQILPDGRITAEVRGTPPGNDHELTQQVVFVESDGTYLIDGIAELPNQGTPTP